MTARKKRPGSGGARSGAGRPSTGLGATIPQIRVTPRAFKLATKAAEAAEQSISEWVREAIEEKLAR